MRGQVNGRHISGAIQPGEMMRGETVSEVVVSNHDDFKPGDFVKHFGGWQGYSVSDGTAMQKLDARIAPHSLALGSLGMPGLTAYAKTKTRAWPSSAYARTGLIYISTMSAAIFWMQP